MVAFTIDLNICLLLANQYSLTVKLDLEQYFEARNPLPPKSLYCTTVLYNIFLKVVIFCMLQYFYMYAKYSKSLLQQ